MNNPTILTLDLKPLGTTTLWEIRDSLHAEYEANKASDNQCAFEAAVAAGVALKQLDSYFAKMDVRRPTLANQIRAYNGI